MVRLDHQVNILGNFMINNLPGVSTILVYELLVLISFLILFLMNYFSMAFNLGLAEVHCLFSLFLYLCYKFIQLSYLLMFVFLTCSFLFKANY